MNDAAVIVQVENARRLTKALNVFRRGKERIMQDAKALGDDVRAARLFELNGDIGFFV